MLSDYNKVCLYEHFRKIMLHIFRIILTCWKPKHGNYCFLSSSEVVLTQVYTVITEHHSNSTSTHQMAITICQTCTTIWALVTISASFSSLPISLQYQRCESNENGRRSVWPDNVKVFKGRGKGVSVLTCERGLSPRCLSLSTPIPVPLRGAAAMLLSRPPGRPMADLHTPSVPEQADVWLCQPLRSDALLRQLKAAQGHSRVHMYGQNNKQRPIRHKAQAVALMFQTAAPKIKQFLPFRYKWHILIQQSLDSYCCFPCSCWGLVMKWKKNRKCRGWCNWQKLSRRNGHFVVKKSLKFSFPQWIKWIGTVAAEVGKHKTNVSFTVWTKGSRYVTHCLQ